MSAHLKDYLVRLAISPDLFTDFVRDPQAALSEAGVPLNERDVFLGGDQDQIYAVLVAERQEEAE